MITIPLAVLMVIIAAAVIKWGKAHAGTLLFGVVVGVCIAATSLGPVIQDGLETLGKQALTAALDGMNGAGEIAKKAGE